MLNSAVRRQQTLGAGGGGPLGGPLPLIPRQEMSCSGLFAPVSRDVPCENSPRTLSLTQNWAVFVDACI